MELCKPDIQKPRDKRRKLTDADIDCIWDMVDSDEFSIKEIAANYGVCRQTIWRVSKKDKVISYVDNVKI